MFKSVEPSNNDSKKVKKEKNELGIHLFLV